MKALEPKLKNRIQVSVEDNRHLRAPADFADAIEHAGYGRARAQGALGRELVDEAVRQRIGEGNPQFQKIDAGFFEREREIDGPRQTRVARADVGDERFFVPGPESSETLVDSIWH